jgi:hopene-associated glycosyltransferase HpnB
MASSVPVFLLAAVGLLCLVIWVYLAVARGGFWRLPACHEDEVRGQGASVRPWPTVTAIVPARNEAATIGSTVASLLEQDYPGRLSIVVIDDDSEDGTAAVARRTVEEVGARSQVKIDSAGALPPGWTGKLWALNKGITRAVTEAPDFYWFTDGDVAHQADTLRRLVTRAEISGLDLASLMVLLRTETFAERATMPAFLFFFLKLYPARWVADEHTGTAGAAGGCILLRRSALERIGGLAVIRGEVIDDCALARAVKRTGGRIWLGLTRRSVSRRGYDSFGEVRDMIARVAFTQLRYSTPRLVAALVGMLLAYAAPVALLLASGWAPRIFGLAAWLLMSVLYSRTVRFYRLLPLWTLLLPLGAVFFSYATLLSALRYWRGQGGQWKGRTQAPCAA